MAKGVFAASSEPLLQFLHCVGRGKLDSYISTTFINIPHPPRLWFLLHHLHRLLFRLFLRSAEGLGQRLRRTFQRGEGRAMTVTVALFRGASRRPVLVGTAATTRQTRCFDGMRRDRGEG